LNILINAIKIIFLLGFLVFIHEGGHFLAARLFKVKVEAFSIGFGPKIFVKKGKETEYSISAIPFGGYVKMTGESARSDEEGAFNKAKVSHRIAIVAAGAIVNIIFGILVYFILVLSSGYNISSIVDSIIPEAISNVSEIEVGDKILKINNKIGLYNSNRINLLYFIFYFKKKELICFVNIVDMNIREIIYCLREQIFC